MALRIAVLQRCLAAWYSGRGSDMRGKTRLVFDA